MVALVEVKSQKPGGRAMTRPVLTPVAFDEGEWMHHRAGDKLALSALIPADQAETRRKKSLSTAWVLSDRHGDEPVERQTLVQRGKRRKAWG